MSFGRIKISWPEGTAIAMLGDTPTTRALVAALPVKAKAQTWGEEVYSRFPSAQSSKATRSRSLRCAVVTP